jgi:RNA polymerase sigma-70 factor (ECF subfamily)
LPDDGTVVHLAERHAEVESRYRTLRGHLDKAIARACPPGLARDRDDLVQAAVLKVMDLERRSSGRRDLSKTYLYRVAHSALVDELRRRQRKAEVSLDEPEALPGVSFEQGTEPAPDRSAAGLEAGRGIRSCLKGLKRERRLAVTLYLQGHSVPESAELLGWSRKRTENLVLRGLADLRQCLLAKGIRP